MKNVSLFGLSCNDKPVLKHTLIINLSPDDEMTITPMVPCYMKPSGCTRWQPLRFGSSTPIKPGDVCSLLPDKCWFKVISVPETMEKNDQTLKRKAEEDFNQDIVDSKKVCLSFNTEAVTSAVETLNDFLNDKDSLAKCPIPVINGNEHGDTAAPFLQEIYSTSYPEGSDVSATCSKISSDLPDAAEASVECESNAKREKRSDESTNVEPEERPTCDLDAHFDQASDQEAIIEAVAPMRDESRSPVARRDRASNSNRENNDVPKREKCTYGTRCYRKNPNHKNNYSHPGDADYDADADEVDNREECPYGNKCYRKNPQHKAQFKHISMPRRRRKVANSAQQPAVVDTETDASSMESVDESDYEPSVYTESSDTRSDSDESRSEWEDGTTG
ncbi:PREDICTED: aprataxin and PNK-like factor isoform X3 [Dinoponera quadriceps]|uniref:Aprataxin and PNK-like factor isoform X3 n=1 Tax=Dinoponera quadriceps TaxID=609295 RepID=A0A6P3X4D7_DINQU|nr:PREDICTED: aprataxin and PNK-like factor isoform X3 [Dinoponera quadriceps]